MEVASPVILWWPILGFWLRGWKAVSPALEILCPRKCSLSFEKDPRRRHPICGKMDAPTLRNLPLDRRPDAASSFCLLRILS